MLFDNMPNMPKYRHEWNAILLEETKPTACATRHIDSALHAPDHCRERLGKD
jgi:hypothetical protein